MKINIEERLNKIIVVGDRVLIKPKSTDEKTQSGLYLPAYIQEKEPVKSGYVMKVGPGYPIPYAAEEEEIWKKKDDSTKYVPLQAKVGDLAIFLQKGTVDIMIENDKYYIVPQNNILLLERDEEV
jgi:chaperonin GroES